MSDSLWAIGFLLSRDAGKSCIQVGFFLSVCSHPLFRSIDWGRGRWLYFRVCGFKASQYWKEGFSKKRFLHFPPNILKVIRNRCRYLIKARKEWPKNFYFKNGTEVRKVFALCQFTAFVLNLLLAYMVGNRVKMS